LDKCEHEVPHQVALDLLFDLAEFVILKDPVEHTKYPEEPEQDWVCDDHEERGPDVGQEPDLLETDLLKGH